MTQKNPGILLHSFLSGCNSLLPPERLGNGQYAWGVNIVNRGGIIQSRPGLDCIASIAGIKIQGGGIFTPKRSKPMMLLAVDGLIYFAKFPFTNFARVDGLKFLASAQVITFKNVLKSAKLNPDGSLALVDPIPMVVIQDGKTLAGTFDGTTGAHSREGAPSFGIPIGLWMAWVSSRLWVFNGSQGKVSDLANPDTFNENTYLAERSNFELPADVMGAIATADEKSLLVFTSTTTTAFQSNIRDRTLWASTPEFQKQILPSIGCVAGLSTVNQYGLTWWFSRAGFINLDAALYTQRTSTLKTVDGEMIRSKRILSPDCSAICSATYENYLLCSVPAGGKYNGQTWCADQAPVGQAGGIPMAWSGVWTGVRPVTWMKTEFAGRERLYFVSYDATPKDATHIHVWEAFKPSRRDNGGRIASQVESAMVSGTELARFCYAELDICETLGNVELKVFVGGRKGRWHQVLETTIQAEIGSIGSAAQKIITKDSILQAFKPQTRKLKTEEFSSQGRGTGGAETKDAPGLDDAFQILVEWRGRMGIKAIRIVTESDASGPVGECKTGETGQVNIILDSGETL